jgi:hypothetical protein
MFATIGELVTVSIDTVDRIWRRSVKQEAFIHDGFSIRALFHGHFLSVVPS